MPGKGRITIITLLFPPEAGAASNRLQSLATALMDDGHDVHVITQLPNYPQRRIYPGYERKLLSRERQDAICVTRIWPLLFRRSTMVWRSIGELWFMLMAFVCSLFGPRPAFILATCPSTFSPFAGWAASLIRRSQFVLEFRDLTWNYASAVKGKSSLLARVLEAAVLWTARRAALVVCTNSYQQRYLIERGVLSDRCLVVPNGIEAGLLDRLASGHADQSGFHVMYVGLVGHAQGLRVLVDTARLLAVDPRYHLTVVGDGLERAELTALAESQGVSNISFVGGVRPEDVAEFYKQADILVAHLRDDPAFDTALPSKLFEYMACRKPVVFGGRGPGADLIAAAGAGLVVTPDSAEAMAEAIQSIANNSGLARQFGEQGHAYVATHYRREVVVRELLQALDGIDPGSPTPTGQLVSGRVTRNGNSTSRRSASREDHQRKTTSQSGPGNPP